MFITIALTITFLIFWDLAGQFGFSIWSKKVNNIKMRKYMFTMPAEIIEPIAVTFRYRLKFRLAGPIGLIYALTYKERV
jgi:hypothetical protein